MDLAMEVRDAYEHARRRRKPPLSDDELRVAITHAHRAVSAARLAREYWRRRTHRNSVERTHALLYILRLLKDVMRPIRSEQARCVYDPRLEILWGADLAETSYAVRKERKKLQKMLP